MKWPSIDVVIPVRNCESQLRGCLDRIRAQSYPGVLRTIVVDGGSSDSTVEVAIEFGAETYVNPGQYSAGLLGARRFGELRSTADLLWLLDSDNVVVEDDAAKRLAVPLVERSDLQLSVPMVQPDPESNRFSNWLALQESTLLERMARQGADCGAYFLVEEFTHGISNATLIRRDALERVGGYDADFLVLRRLRSVGLARGAVVPTAHIIHNQARGALDFRRKWIRRMKYYASMPPKMRRDYFVAHDYGTDLKDPYSRGVTFGTVVTPFNAIRGFIRSSDATWLCGLAYPLVVASIGLTQPSAVRRAMTVFTGGSRIKSVD